MDIDSIATVPADAAASRPPARAAGPDLEALLRWLAPHLPALRPPCTLERIDGGQSNPTWILRGAGAGAWVLRAKPAPAASLPASAHAIEREAHVLRALEQTAVPVPRVRVVQVQQYGRGQEWQADAVAFGSQADCLGRC